MCFDTPVTISEVTTTSVRKIKCSPDYFNFSNVQCDEGMVRDLGFAGFKVLYPVDNEDRNDEIVSILSASCFHVLGQDQVYGLSVRDLAINTALSSGEESPRSYEFWVEHPRATDKHLAICASLDSPRITGAYHFVIVPEHGTVMSTQSEVYLRDKVSKLGAAPLTSTLLFGSNRPSPIPDYRPTLHDPNGLSILVGDGEWIWRSLDSPKHPVVSNYAMGNP